MAVNFDKSLSFSFDGKKYKGYEGDTVASALFRAGVRIFSRSLRYARARGLTCMSSASASSLLTIDGIPNQRSGMTVLKEGMVAQRQNHFDLDKDMEHVLDRFEGIYPTGFAYKTWEEKHDIRKRFNDSQRKAGGLGVIDAAPLHSNKHPEDYFDKQYVHADVVVIGGGPAGLAAAMAAVEAGQGGIRPNIVLIDENPALGGHIRFQSNAIQAEHPQVVDLIAKVHESEAIQVYLSSTAIGVYEENWLAVDVGNRLLKMRAEQIIVATGRIEQPLVFHNNDLPGVMMGSGVQRLMHLHDVKPAKRAIVCTSNDEGHQVAQDLLAKGVELVAIADARTSTALDIDADLPIYAGFAIQEAVADDAGVVSAAVIVELDTKGKPIADTQRLFDCDLIVQSYGYMANSTLLTISGSKSSYDASLDDYIIGNFVEGISAAGHVLGATTVEAALLEGKLAAYKIARRLEDSESNHLQALKNSYRSERKIRPLVSIASDGDKKFVDLSADATEDDVHNGYAEGFRDIQTLKRYTTITMGLDQGKASNMNFMRVLAEAKGEPQKDVGRVTMRPPFSPIKLGTLAGRMFEPTRYSPMHDSHVKLGATWTNAGQWKRVSYYGNSEKNIDEEVMAVHKHVGMIDVSTLGKIELHGPDSLELITRLFTGSFAKLPIGQIRYCVMCNEEGVMIDDGVIAHIAENHYVITTTSGTSGSAYEWLEWWRVSWNLSQCHSVNITSSYAAMNIAGPKVREVLTQHTEIDISNEAFPYMAYREGNLLGVPVRMMRIGFVGELGYEIHCSADYADSLWNKLLEIGKPQNIRPFGVEAQRTLRLEKKHIILGQDSDALSDPYGADMGFAVRLSKKDNFIGKPSLRRIKDKGSKEVLTAFSTQGKNLALEGEQILDGDRLIGRITSSRYSPTLAKGIGLCWIKAEYDVAGKEVMIRHEGKALAATIQKDAFYDPSGERLRS